MTPGYSKVPHHGQGPVAATRAFSALKGTEQQTASGLDAHGRPVRLVLTGGTAADCARAPALATDLPAQYLLADRGYDTIAMVVGAVEQGMVTEILPRSHRKGPRYYDRGPLSAAPYGGERIPELQAMENGGDALCRKDRVSPRHLTD